MQPTTLSGIIDHLRALADLIEGEIPPRRTAHTPPATAMAPAEASGTTHEAFERRGAALVSHRVRSPMDDALLPVARHMMSTHPRCEPLILAVKRAQGTSQPVRLDLESATQEEIGAMTTLGTQAARAQLLASYRYRKTPRRELLARPPKTPAGIAFFTGQWLELAVWDHAQQLCAPRGWDVVSNAIIRLPSGDQFEVDLVLCDPSGRLVIAETKTSEHFADDLPKLARVMAALILPARDGLLIASALDARNAAAAAAQACMTAVTLDALPAVFEGLFASSGQPLSAPSQRPVLSRRA